MSAPIDVVPSRWRSALAEARARRSLDATVALEAQGLTITLSDGRIFTATSTVSAQRALAAAIQWARRQGATDVTVIQHTEKGHA